MDYDPAKVRVLRLIRYKYACKSCQGVEDDGATVKIAPAPVQLVEKSMATEGLLAHIVVSKFADARDLTGQTAVVALGFVGLLAYMDTGYYLRSGCDLIPQSKPQLEIVGRTLEDIDTHPIDSITALETLLPTSKLPRARALKSNQSACPAAWAKMNA